MLRRLTERLWQSWKQQRDEMRAGQKRELAERELKLAETTAKVAKVVPLVTQLAKVSPVAEILQTKLETFMKRPPAAAPAPANA